MSPCTVKENYEVIDESGTEERVSVFLVHIRLYIYSFNNHVVYDTQHSGTMIYAVTLRNSQVSRYGKIACE